MYNLEFSESPRFESGLAIVAALLVAIVLFAWSCSFTGLYSSDGALVVRLISCIFVLSSLTEATKMVFGMSTNTGDPDTSTSRRPAMPTLPFLFDDDEPTPTNEEEPNTPEEDTPTPSPEENNEESNEEETPGEEESPESETAQEPDVTTSDSAALQPLEPEEEPIELIHPMQASFNEMFQDILTVHGDTTASNAGTWIRYNVSSQYAPIKGVFNPALRELLLQNGFSLHHEAYDKYKMNDILMSHEAMNCKFTCVRECINIMFFDSNDALMNNIAGTLAHLHSIYSNPLR